MEIKRLPYFQILKDKAQQIDIIAKRTIETHNKKIHEKYSSIENTIKILKNMIIQFTKKSEKLQKRLLSQKRIEQIKQRDQYYKKRVEEYQKESQEVVQKINRKTEAFRSLQKQLQTLRKQLMKFKTNNIKKVIRIQEMQYFLTQEQLRDQKLAIKSITNQKKNHQRMMITSKTLNVSQQQLIKQDQNINAQLCHKIQSIVQVDLFIKQSYTLLLNKLTKAQKKSNLYGLSGSLLFRLKNSDIAPKNKYIVKRDSKLMIYDVLKGRYNRVMQEKKHEMQKSICISKQQFMNFNPLQIIGIIQLKGGLEQIKKKQSLIQTESIYFDQLKANKTQYSNIFNKINNTQYAKTSLR